MKNISLLLLFLVLFSCELLAGYSEQILQDQPVGWWRFDDYRYKDGFAAKDQTGNFTGAVFDGDVMTVEAGIDGKCGWFNGNKAGVEIGNLGDILNGSSAITFEAWIYNSFLSDAKSVQRIFATRIYEAKAGIDVSIHSYENEGGKIRLGVRSCESDPYNTVEFDFNSVQKWVHLVCVVDFAGGNVKVYYDGKLAGAEAVDFQSEKYVYSGATEADQIARTPDLKSAFRGYLDEVAIYNKALSKERILSHFTAVSPRVQGSLWVSEIYHDEEKMVHGPSIVLFDDGDMLVSYYNRGATSVKLSRDGGKSWSEAVDIKGVQFASLFEHGGAVYLLGISRNPGHICIAKTTDKGASWSDVAVLAEAKEPGTYGYHTGPVPVITANGKIYRVFEERVTTDRWPIAYAAFVFSADQSSDLMQPESWSSSNAIKFEREWVDPAWNCTSPGWLEGNIVAAANGKLRVLMRVHTNPIVDKAAILALSDNGKQLSYNPKIGIIDMPGGMHMFHIKRCPVSGEYLTLNNNNTDPSRSAQRNTLSLVASKDLINWRHIRTILQDNSPMSWRDSLLKIGFQYVVWEFDGDDIIYASRTAYDGAPNYHDSNKITFHKLENYLDFIKDKK